MIAFTGAVGIIGAYLIAGFLGYLVGIEQCRTRMRYGRRR